MPAATASPTAPLLLPARHWPLRALARAAVLAATGLGGIVALWQWQGGVFPSWPGLVLVFAAPPMLAVLAHLAFLALRGRWSARVADDGLHGHDLLGRPRHIGWSAIEAVQVVDLYGLPWAVLYPRVSAPPVWLPHTLEGGEAALAALEARLAPTHALLRALRAPARA
jgi:hypothetical protein